MKMLCSLMLALILRQAIAGIVRKPPAFSTPVYSNSYLPAAMQVIFHTVEQLKLLQSEEISQEHVTTRATSTIQSIKRTQQTQSTTSIVITTEVRNVNTEAPELPATLPSMIGVSSHGSSEFHDDLTEAAQHGETLTVSVPAASDGGHEESPEVNEETAETNYVTPETNHESPESVQETQEINQEIPEKSEEERSSTVEYSFSEIPKIVTSQREDDAPRQQSTQASVSEASDVQRRKEPTIDSVVGEIYGIVRPTTFPLLEESYATDDAKIATGISIEKMESIEDEEEETRFTLLGEKVAQVPRPSLNSYLRRAKVPPNRALQQLANLYDVLSKDARKQGLARFAGYSESVLKTLQSSAEGGVGPQLKNLLGKVVERNELTRDDAKMKTSEALRDLDDPASALSKDLRRLLPLRYMA